MNSVIAADTEKLINLSVKPFTEAILKRFYPQLFLMLNQMDFQVKGLKPELDVSLLLTVQAKMNEELDELYRREKLVLFPYLQRLEGEHKLSDTCKPFKNVKYHYTYLLSTAQQFKTLINQAMHDGERVDDLQSLKETILDFEKALITVQQCKEQHLYRKFRNCSGSCKTFES